MSYVGVVRESGKCGVGRRLRSGKRGGRASRRHVARGIDGADRRSCVVRGAGSKQRGNFVGIGKARFGSVVEELDLRIQTSKVLVHYELHLLV